MSLTTAAGPSDDELRAALDLTRLESFEGALADAAEALEQVERIRRSDVSAVDRAAAIRKLSEDLRFAVVASADAVAEAIPGTAVVGATQPSDLVGHGDLGTVEQVEAVSQHDTVVVDVHPPSAQVGDPLEG